MSNIDQFENALKQYFEIVLQSKFHLKIDHTVKHMYTKCCVVLYYANGANIPVSRIRLV